MKEADTKSSNSSDFFSALALDNLWLYGIWKTL